jgi:hypothetical protein
MIAGKRVLNISLGNNRMYSIGIRMLDQPYMTGKDIK